MTSIPYDAWKDGVGVPGTWHGGRKGGGSRTASICCSKCKKIVTLTNHEIKTAGIVNPSVVCPHDGCDFHEFVQLGGWDYVREGG